MFAGVAVVSALGHAPGLRSESPAAPESRVGFRGDEILGTRGLDVLYGTAAGDNLFAFGADDHVEGGDGSDLIDLGNGEDFVDAGPGDDRVRAFDGDRDVVRCGDGIDIAFVDAKDVTTDCEDSIESDDVSAPATPVPPSTGSGEDAPSPPLSGKVVLEEEAWVCSGPVDLDLVKVSLGSNSTSLDAVTLGQNCTGRIRRLEVDTQSGDGIKVQNGNAAAHDLVIESGYVRCHSQTHGYHQDGIQVMGGHRITFRGLSVFCGGVGVNAALFIARGGSGDTVPTDVVLENGLLGPGAAHTILLGGSVRSGARDTVICPGRFDGYRVRGRAVSAVNIGNVTAAASHRRC